MIDKELIKLVNGSSKLIIKCTLLNLLALIANVCITAGICLAISITISRNTDETDLGWYILPFNAIIGGIVLRYLASLISGKKRAMLGAMVKKDLRDRLVFKLLELEGMVEEQIGAAGITQISIEGIEQLDLYFTNYIPQFFFAMASPIILFIICAAIEIGTALILLACLPVIPIAIIFTSKYAKKVFAKYWGKYITMGDGFLDALQGLRELKMFMADDVGAKKLANNADEFRKVTMKVLIMQLASITIMDLVAFGGAGLGIARAVIEAEGGLNPVHLFFLILLAAEFFLPLRALGSAFHVAMNGASAGKKILTILKLVSPHRGTSEFGNMPINLKDVSFSYNNSREILKKINLLIPSRSIIALTGESGSGKTTLSKIMLGQILPTSGEIIIGDKNIAEITRESLYKNAAITGESSYIFNESIFYNFKLAKPDVTENEIWEALKKVQLYEFVKKNGGLGKSIYEGASNLSGGEKQRLALAINLTLKKQLYIFDEATSAIDKESEKIIIENILALKRFASVVLITHRLINTEFADYIYHIKQGVLVESGSYKELISKNGEYASLYNKQTALQNGGAANA
ncbi:MAG: ATP-binding cassette domain-containing protein [Christensenellaceae bacterium]|jgi:ABC-type transport system involved in cytochrome bd biosynthesis fused ATPase/permease subunit|nr:ATP-binding cassette domain-containing protein [Christensenellaceae bacterium]